MQNIRRLLFIGGAVLLLAGCGTKVIDSMESVSRNREVRALTEGLNAPFEFGAGTGFQGMGADVGEEIAKTFGYPLKWISSRGAAHLFDLLREGTAADMIISSVASDPQRTAQFDFSEPYYKTGDVIAHHRTDFGITDLASLSGKRVGVVADRPADYFMESQTTATNVTILKYATIDEALGYLNRREIDSIVGDEILITYSVDGYPNINILDTIINEYSYVVAVRKGDATFLEKINETILRLKDSGELAQLEEKWIGDVRERAKARASADRELEELKKSPKTINASIIRQGGNWSMERLDGFQFVLQGANGTFRSTPIVTDGVSRGTCRFTQPVPPGSYTLNISILNLSATVDVPVIDKTTLSMTVSIAASMVTIDVK